MGAYKRVLLKLSGESLGGPAGKGIDENWLAAYAEEIAEAVKNGLQVAIVIGGGNIFRGLQGVGKGFDRVNGDKMGAKTHLKIRVFFRVIYRISQRNGIKHVIMSRKSSAVKIRLKRRHKRAHSVISLNGT